MNFCNRAIFREDSAADGSEGIGHGGGQVTSAGIGHGRPQSIA
jgi:hypothetical protein